MNFRHWRHSLKPSSFKPHPEASPEETVDEFDRLYERRGIARARTIFYSTICSGLVALGIGYIFVTDSSNQQAQRSQRNCVQVVRLSDALATQADDTARANDGVNPDVAKRWAGYRDDIDKLFPPQIGDPPARVSYCKKTFPTKPTIPFIK